MREANMFMEMRNIFVGMNPSLDGMLIMIKANSIEEAEKTAQKFMDEYLNLLNTDSEGIMPFTVTLLDDAMLFEKFTCPYVIEVINGELTPNINHLSFAIDHPGIIRTGAEVYEN